MGEGRRRPTDLTSLVLAPSLCPIVTAVTKLLVATRQLLDALTHWSTGKISETEVRPTLLATRLESEKRGEPANAIAS